MKYLRLAARSAGLILIVALAFFIGFELGDTGKSDKSGSFGIAGVTNPSGAPGTGADRPGGAPSQAHESHPVKYACAMFCVPPLERPGKCPVCGMEMVPVESDGHSAGESMRPADAPGRDSVDNTLITASTESRTSPVEADAPSGGTQSWTCSMHPQIIRPNPGKCPICSMDLVPAQKSQAPTIREAGAGPGGKSAAPGITLSERARSLAMIRTSEARLMAVTAEVRMIGKVTFDETRLSYITSWIKGRIDRLFVDYTGITVKRGDHMVYLFSPDLITAQAELLQSIETAGRLMKSDVPLIRDSARGNTESARQKLRLMGLSASQIEAIERSGKPSDHLTIYSPASGIVVHKNAVDGMYVDVGTRIYTIADLSAVWVLLEAYESDLPWVKPGQPVEFGVEAHPGRIFRGRISFIDPVLNERTRTVKVRINVENSDSSLKPGMLVRAVIRAKVAGKGRVVDSYMAGKWMCPMHPETLSDRPEPCPSCGMPKARTESLGFVSGLDLPNDLPLVIPASAPLVTGRRAVVYVANPDRPGYYELREIVLGPRAGDHFVVESGLSPGERIVTMGNFKIDSALQIRGERSMMSGQRERGDPLASMPAETPKPGSGAPMRSMASMEQATPASGPGAAGSRPAGISHGAVIPDAALQGLIEGYLAIGAALSGDDAAGSARAAGEAVAAIGENTDAEAEDLLRNLQGSVDLPAARVAFCLLSESLIATLERDGGEERAAWGLFRVHCPMAFNNRGADWVQRGRDVRNPYFGSSMLTCGGIVTGYGPKAGETQGAMDMSGMDERGR